MSLQASGALILQRLLVAEYLAFLPSSGVIDPAWAVSRENAPVGPLLANNYVTFYNTAAFEDGRLMTTGERTNHLGWHAIIRGPEFNDTGWLQGKAIEDLFDGYIYQELVIPETNETVLIWAISIRKSLSKIGVEEMNRRQLYSISGYMTAEVAP